MLRQGFLGIGATAWKYNTLGQQHADLITIYLGDPGPSPVGYWTCNFPLFHHIRPATNGTVPIIIIATSVINPPYGSMFRASEALAVLVVEEAVPVLVPVEVAELEVAAAVAGTEESFASVY